MKKNAVEALGDKIAGGRKAYRALSSSERSKIRVTAKQLHELGADFTTARKAEKTDKRGFVYCITHPSWPEYVKVGRAFNPESRLRGYQTGCPVRGYELRYAVYFNDCYMAEREIHARISAYDNVWAEGEWFRCDITWAKHQINQLREVI